MTTNEKHIIEILKNISIFQGISDEQAQLFIPILEPMSFPPNATILKESTKGESMYIILDGTVKVTKEDNEEEILIGLLYSGSYFGEFSLIDNLPRSATITTVEDTKIFKLTKDNFQNLLESNMVISNLLHKNFLKETFARFRNTVSNFTFSQHILHEKSSELHEINKDISEAKKIQGYFINTHYLDDEKSQNKFMKHSYIYEPCIGIGGDFLNIVELEEDLVGIIIADVTGHGITAALATGVLKSALSFLIKQFPRDPLALMSELNNHFTSVVAELFATCYYAIIDTKQKKIKMVKAGHHHPLFWKKSLNDFWHIECAGTGIGMMKNARFGSVEFEIEEGDKLLFFTDGIIEQMNNKDEMYSEKRLKNMFKQFIIGDDPKILKKIFSDLKEFAGEVSFEDDVTLLLLEM